MLSPGDRSAIQQQQQQLLDENQRQRDALERSAPLTITPSPETSAGTEGPLLYGVTHCCQWGHPTDVCRNRPTGGTVGESVS